MKGKKVLMMALAAAMMPFAAFAQPTDSWTGSCTYDDSFRSQGTLLATLAPALNLPFPSWDAFDIDADGVSDASRSFPDEERCGLANPIRHAANSISSNIAEGSARPNADFAKFVGYAKGSRYGLRKSLGE